MAAKSVARLLAVPARSFFLFGPRGTGKNTWLRRTFPKSLYLDLLDTSLALELPVGSAASEPPQETGMGRAR